MRRHVPPALVLLAACLACAGPSGQRLSAAEYQELERRSAARPEAPSRANDPELRKDRQALEDRERELAKRREDHAHEDRELAAKRSVLEIDHAIALSDETLDLARSQRELRRAQSDLTHFETAERPRRTEEAALDLQGSADRLLETREELAQLEMMYDESELGDATAEIVLERTRRRLLRAEQRHALQQQVHAELVERTLPRELEERKATLVEKQVALENTKRRLEKQALERSAQLRKLDHENRTLARTLESIEVDAGKLEDDRKAFERRFAGAESGA